MKAHYEYTLHRGGLRKPDALEVGALVHIALDAILREAMWEPIVEEALAELEPVRAVELSELVDELRPAIAAWKKPEDWRVIGSEMELSVPCGPHTIVGRLDAVVEWNGSFWNLQHKTLGASVPVAVYCEQQRTDWHESVYHRMAERASFVPFAGTILNIVRKLSAKRIAEFPNDALIPPQYLPRSDADVDEAFQDLQQLIDDIATQGDGGRRVVKCRSSCAGPFRNSLCVYKPVCDGDDVISSENYMDLEPRYAPD